ncbi:MAG TPA: RNA 2'-phosphotransferase [Kofleriaceae bacterium]|nr:RNA 2'-phosphotransferase [Kofleriaceae bacterium]
MTTDDTRTSKLLSYVLRHHPDAAGVTLDPQGWVDVDALLRGLNARGTVLTRTDLDRIVAADRKGRYAYSDDGARIRANQGHSVEVDLGYEPAVPPALLYHGTAEPNVASIMATGLDRRERHHVHLSAAVATARQVGGRHGRPVVLNVDAARMHADGFAFFVTANGVWLVERVPPAYLTVPALAR